MEAAPGAERAVEPVAERPEAALLQSCGRLAARWGGSDYVHGLIDGVEITRGVQELHEESDSRILFNAYHVRPAPNGDYLFQVNKFFTRYVVSVEVSREIDVLPPYIHEAVAEALGEEAVENADVLKEIHRVFCRINDADGYFDQILQVDYSMDDHEIDLADDGGSEDDEDDDEVDWQSVETSHIPSEGELDEDEVGLSDESQLLNDAWELFAVAGEQLQNGDSPFDLEMLKSMARIDRRLERQETKMTRLFSIALLEIRNLQMHNCRNILKKFNPNKSM